MIFCKSRYIPYLKESYLCEPYSSPSCLQVFISYNMAELQNRSCFISATKCRNFNIPAINITFCCCQDVQQAAHRLLLFLLSQQAADMFCSKVCKCKSPSSLKFRATFLAEVTLNALHYIRCTWKMSSEMETAFSKK